MECVNITGLSGSQKAEIAGYIREANLAWINEQVITIHPKDSFYTRYGKRVLDFILATLALVITAPLNLILAIITYFDVGSPIIFRQERIGRNGKKFCIVKFRNMTNECDANGELLPPNERVTKWGRFVRKVSLDELLNFWSIFHGDMSVVGPRPLLNDYFNRFNKRDLQRYAVRPGLECPSIECLDHAMSWEERLANDIWYVQNCSLLVDLKLCFRIVQVAFDHKATEVRSNASAGGFLGYNRDGSIITTQNVPKKYCDMYCERHGMANIEAVISGRKESENIL